MARHGQAVPRLSTRALSAWEGTCDEDEVQRQEADSFLCSGRREGDAWVGRANRMTLTFLGPRGDLLVLSAREWQPHHLTPVQSSLCQSQVALSPSVRTRGTFQAHAAPRSWDFL